MTVVLWQASEAVLLMPVLFAGSEQAYSDERAWSFEVRVFPAAQQKVGFICSNSRRAPAAQRG
jgi:hypothetical protein